MNTMKNFAPHVLMFLLLFGCDGRVDVWERTCKDFPSVVYFPLSSAYWISREIYERKDGRNIDLNLLGVDVRVPVGEPNELVVRQIRGVTSIEIVYPNTSFSMTFLNLAGDRIYFLDRFATILAAEDSQELRLFVDADFSEQLTWYSQYGQGAYSCIYEESLRDAKKFMVEYILQGFGALSAADLATIENNSVYFYKHDSRFSLSYSSSGWLVTSAVQSNESEIVSLPGSNTDVYLANIEEFVINPEKDAEWLRRSLQDMPIKLTVHQENVE